MALENCRECGHEMSSSARKCPNCGWKRPNVVLRVLLGVVGAGAAWLAISAATTPQYELDAFDRRKACEALVGADPYGRSQCAADYHRQINEGRTAAAQGTKPAPYPRPHAGCREEKFSWGIQYVCE